MTAVQISARRVDGVTILDLKGRLILGPAAESLSTEIGEAIATGARTLLLNMKGVTQVDTTGISTIVRAFVSMQRSGGKFGIFHVTERVRLVLDVTRLLRVIPCFPGEAEALASLR